MNHRQKKCGVWLSVLGVLAVLLLEGAFYAALLLFALPAALPLLLLTGGVLLAVGIGVLWAAWARIKEINGGEEDDLSQY